MWFAAPHEECHPLVVVARCRCRALLQLLGLTRKGEQGQHATLKCSGLNAFADCLAFAQCIAVMPTIDDVRLVVMQLRC